jgi:hypothetical protein
MLEYKETGRTNKTAEMNSTLKTKLQQGTPRTRGGGIFGGVIWESRKAFQSL